MRAAGRGNREGHLLSPVHDLDRPHAAGDLGKSLIPGDPSPDWIGGSFGRCAPQRLRQAVRMIDQFGCRAALWTEFVASWMARQRFDAIEAPILNDRKTATARAALGAERGGASSLTHVRNFDATDRGWQLNRPPSRMAFSAPPCALRARA
jgi:hypothetical protein